MNISEHLDKNNLHHAYLIQGARDEIVREVLSFLESFGIKTSGNPDFCHITIDSLKIDDALNLRKMGSEKAFTVGKKIFLICINSSTLDAQGVLLKMFEEPIENTHFFLIVPEGDIFLKTLISRFYFISVKPKLDEELKYAEKFIAMPLRDRIDFLKELLAESDNEEDEDMEMNKQDSPRSKALKFLNMLEFVLHRKFLKNPATETYFSHFFKVREFLRQPGSSAKSLMESIALAIPNF